MSVDSPRLSTVSSSRLSRPPALRLSISSVSELHSQTPRSGRHGRSSSFIQITSASPASAIDMLRHRASATQSATSPTHASSSVSLQSAMRAARQRASVDFATSPSNHHVNLERFQMAQLASREAWRVILNKDPTARSIQEVRDLSQWLKDGLAATPTPTPHNHPRTEHTRSTSSHEHTAAAAAVTSPFLQQLPSLVLHGMSRNLSLVSMERGETARVGRSRGFGNGYFIVLSGSVAVIQQTAQPPSSSRSQTSSRASSPSRRRASPSNHSPIASTPRHAGASPSGRHMSPPSHALLVTADQLAPATSSDSSDSAVATPTSMTAATVEKDEESTVDEKELTKGLHLLGSDASAIRARARFHVDAVSGRRWRVLAAGDGFGATSLLDTLLDEHRGVASLSAEVDDAAAIAARLQTQTTTPASAAAAVTPSAGVPVDAARSTGTANHEPSTPHTLHTLSSSSAATIGLSLSGVSIGSVHGFIPATHACALLGPAELLYIPSVDFRSACARARLGHLNRRIESLRRVFLFNRWPYEKLAKFASGLRRIAFPAGHTVFTQGDLAQHVFFLDQGELQMEYDLRLGRSLAEKRPPTHVFAASRTRATDQARLADPQLPANMHLAHGGNHAGVNCGVQGGVFAITGEDHLSRAAEAASLRATRGRHLSDTRDEHEEEESDSGDEEAALVSHALESLNRGVGLGLSSSADSPVVLSEGLASDTKLIQAIRAQIDAKRWSSGRGDPESMRRAVSARRRTGGDVTAERDATRFKKHVFKARPMPAAFREHTDGSAEKQLAEMTAAAAAAAKKREAEAAAADALLAPPLSAAATAALAAEKLAASQAAGAPAATESGVSEMLAELRLEQDAGLLLRVQQVRQAKIEGQRLERMRRLAAREREAQERRAEERRVKRESEAAFHAMLRASGNGERRRQIERAQHAAAQSNHTHAGYITLHPFCTFLGEMAPLKPDKSSGTTSSGGPQRAVQFFKFFLLRPRALRISLALEETIDLFGRGSAAAANQTAPVLPRERARGPSSTVSTDDAVTGAAVSGIFVSFGDAARPTPHACQWRGMPDALENVISNHPSSRLSASSTPRGSIQNFVVTIEPSETQGTKQDSVWYYIAVQCTYACTFTLKLDLMNGGDTTTTTTPNAGGGTLSSSLLPFTHSNSFYTPHHIVPLARFSGTRPTLFGDLELLAVSPLDSTALRLTTVRTVTPVVCFVMDKGVFFEHLKGELWSRLQAIIRKQKKIYLALVGASCAMRYSTSTTTKASLYQRAMFVRAKLPSDVNLDPNSALPSAARKKNYHSMYRGLIASKKAGGGSGINYMFTQQEEEEEQEEEEVPEEDQQDEGQTSDAKDQSGALVALSPPTSTHPSGGLMLPASDSARVAVAGRPRSPIRWDSQRSFLELFGLDAWNERLAASLAQAARDNPQHDPQPKSWQVPTPDTRTSGDAASGVLLSADQEARFHFRMHAAVSEREARRRERRRLKLLRRSAVATTEQPLVEEDSDAEEQVFVRANAELNQPAAAVTETALIPRPTNDTHSETITRSPSSDAARMRFQAAIASSYDALRSPAPKDRPSSSQDDVDEDSRALVAAEDDIAEASRLAVEDTLALLESGDDSESDAVPPLFPGEEGLDGEPTSPEVDSHSRDPIDIHAHEKVRPHLEGATPQHFFLSHGGRALYAGMGAAPTRRTAGPTSQLAARLRSRASRSHMGARLDSVWFIERESERKWLSHQHEHEQITAALAGLAAMETSQLATAALTTVLQTTHKRLRDPAAELERSDSAATITSETAVKQAAPRAQRPDSAPDFYPPSSSVHPGVGLTAKGSAILSAQVPHLADLVVAAEESMDRYGDENLPSAVELSIAAATAAANGQPVAVIARRRIEGAPAPPPHTEPIRRSIWTNESVLTKVVDPVPRLALFRVSKTGVEATSRTLAAKRAGPRKRRSPLAYLPDDDEDDAPAAPLIFDINRTIGRPTTSGGGPVPDEPFADARHFPSQQYPSDAPTLHAVLARQPVGSNLQPRPIQPHTPISFKDAIHVSTTTVSRSSQSIWPSAEEATQPVPFNIRTEAARHTSHDERPVHELVHIRPWRPSPELFSSHLSHHVPRLPPNDAWVQRARERAAAAGSRTARTARTSQVKSRPPSGASTARTSRTHSRSASRNARGSTTHARSTSRSGVTVPAPPTRPPLTPIMMPPMVNATVAEESHQSSPSSDGASLDTPLSMPPPASHVIDDDTLQPGVLSDTESNEDDVAPSTLLTIDVAATRPRRRDRLLGWPSMAMSDTASWSSLPLDDAVPTPTTASVLASVRHLPFGAFLTLDAAGPSPSLAASNSTGSGVSAWHDDDSPRHSRPASAIRRVSSGAYKRSNGATPISSPRHTAAAGTNWPAVGPPTPTARKSGGKPFEGGATGATKRNRRGKSISINSIGTPRSRDVRQAKAALSARASTPRGSSNPPPIQIPVPPTTDTPLQVEPPLVDPPQKSPTSVVEQPSSPWFAMSHRRSNSQWRPTAAAGVRPQSGRTTTTPAAPRIDDEKELMPDVGVASASASSETRRPSGLSLSSELALEHSSLFAPAINFRHSRTHSVGVAHAPHVASTVADASRRPSRVGGDLASRGLKVRPPQPPRRQLIDELYEADHLHAQTQVIELTRITSEDHLAVPHAAALDAAPDSADSGAESDTALSAEDRLIRWRIRLERIEAQQARVRAASEAAERAAAEDAAFESELEEESTEDPAISEARRRTRAARLARHASLTFDEKAVAEALDLDAAARELSSRLAILGAAAVIEPHQERAAREETTEPSGRATSDMPHRAHQAMETSDRSESPEPTLDDSAPRTDDDARETTVDSRVMVQPIDTSHKHLHTESLTGMPASLISRRPSPAIHHRGLHSGDDSSPRSPLSPAITASSPRVPTARVFHATIPNLVLTFPSPIAESHTGTAEAHAESESVVTHPPVTGLSPPHTTRRMQHATTRRTSDRNTRTRSARSSHTSKSPVALLARTIAPPVDGDHVASADPRGRTHRMSMRLALSMRTPMLSHARKQLAGSSLHRLIVRDLAATWSSESDPERRSDQAEQLVPTTLAEPQGEVHHHTDTNDAAVDGGDRQPVPPTSVSSSVPPTTTTAPSFLPVRDSTDSFPVAATAADRDRSRSSGSLWVQAARDDRAQRRQSAVDHRQQQNALRVHAAEAERVASSVFPSGSDPASSRSTSSSSSSSRLLFADHRHLPRVELLSSSIGLRATPLIEPRLKVRRATTMRWPHRQAEVQQIAAQVERERHREEGRQKMESESIAQATTL